MNVREKIIEYIKKRFPSSVEDSESDIDLTLILDSFAIHDFILYLEEELSIKVEDDDITSDKFSTLNQLESFLKTKVNKK
tara:strand:- start:297 stop:536 length:240 start_codon:yes stop_codon:yes gene_type:complete